MAAQFGKWNFNGIPLDPNYLRRVSEVLAPYGPDGATTYSGHGASILFYAFHTTTESRSEGQPHVSSSGAVLAWEGRLDNRTDLLSRCRGFVPNDASDVSIVAEAYERSGLRSFADLIGDWSLSIFDPKNRCLILAKDPIGTRHLYYSIVDGSVAWCSVLDPFVRCAGTQLNLDQEYLAGWLASRPPDDATPFRGIHSVPASCFVRIQPAKSTVQRYWDFDPGREIRYRSDAEYEEQFRVVFRESVRRRLRSERPVLAELSGGLDSSSIVCMADTLFARGLAETPGLDTVSYYDEAEPNWNERPYFTRIEEFRGRSGCHIDLSAPPASAPSVSLQRLAAAPTSTRTGTVAPRMFSALLASQGNRVLLCGAGGDEIMGGVPTPLPELQDLVARARLIELGSQLKAWALVQRVPWFHLLAETLRDFLPEAAQSHGSPAPWLRPCFARMRKVPLHHDRKRLFGPLPSSQEFLRTIQALRRQLACADPPSDPPYEKRYPYLDRDLLEFIGSIPRSQLVRPGHRRSLMRRALAGIVPAEILNRRRKAFVVRAALAAVSEQAATLAEETRMRRMISLRLLDWREFFRVLDGARRGQKVPVASVLRTFALERWLETMAGTGVVAGLSAGSTR